VLFDFQPANPEMALVGAPLIYLTMGKMADHLFGGDNTQRTLRGLFQEKK